MFAIDEVTMFEGENWTEKKYAVAGDILDGHLYDLFMTMLEVRPTELRLIGSFVCLTFTLRSLIQAMDILSITASQKRLE